MRQNAAGQLRSSSPNSIVNSGLNPSFLTSLGSLNSIFLNVVVFLDSGPRGRAIWIDVNHMMQNVERHADRGDRERAILERRRAFEPARAILGNQRDIFDHRVAPRHFALHFEAHFLACQPREIVGQLQGVELDADGFRLGGQYLRDRIAGLEFPLGRRAALDRLDLADRHP